MAGFKTECRPQEGEVVKIVTFRGKEYSEVWEEDGNFCYNTILKQIYGDYPELEEDEGDIEKILNDITEGDSNEDVLNALLELEEYE